MDAGGIRSARSCLRHILKRFIGPQKPMLRIEGIVAETLAGAKVPEVAWNHRIAPSLIFARRRGESERAWRGFGMERFNLLRRFS